jgi:hypothetical protein
MSVSFLLQAIRTLHIGNHTNEDINLIYEYLISLDYRLLNEYYYTNSILSYHNDLELYNEVVNEVINIFELNEEYEKCAKLKNKKDLSEGILKFNTE